MHFLKCTKCLLSVIAKYHDLLAVQYFMHLRLTGLGDHDIIADIIAI